MDRQRLGDVTAMRLRHRLERFAEIVVSSPTMTLAFVGELGDHGGSASKISSSTPTTPSQLDFLGLVAGVRRQDLHLAVRDDLVLAEAVVERRRIWTCCFDLRAPQPADNSVCR
jgi:hypothetical protein